MALKSFGTRSFAAITFVALFGAQSETTPVVQTAAPLVPAGVRFIPARVGSAVAKPYELFIRHGGATAVGENGVIPAAAVATPSSVTILAPPVRAYGAAIATSRGVVTEVGRGQAVVSAAATGHTASLALPVTHGGSVVTAAASYEAIPVQVQIFGGLASATGILNPSEEEMILMYLRHRSSKRLQKR